MVQWLTMATPFRLVLAFQTVSRPQTGGSRFKANQSAQQSV
jgi:hypothetical protein